MDLNTLTGTPAWEWPDGTDDFLLDVLLSSAASADDRLVAAELAGDYVVVNDHIARALLGIAANRSAEEDLRCTAAISLGPALEDADSLDDEMPDETVISEEVFAELRRGLRKIYMDADSPDKLRRSVLEAAVRAPEDWHREAVRGAYHQGNSDWRLTAVFCMRFVDAFEDEVVEALGSEDVRVLREAILAAGNKGIEAAWPVVENLLVAPSVDRSLRLAAIEACPGIRAGAAFPILARLEAADDEEIADAAQEALAIYAGGELLTDVDFGNGSL